MFKELINIGIKPDDTLDVKRKKRLLNSVLLTSLILNLASIIFSFNAELNFNSQNFLLTKIDSIIFIFLFFTFFLIKKASYKIAARYFVSVLMLYFAFFSLIFPGTDAEFVIFPVILLSFILFDDTKDLILTTTAGLILFRADRTLSNKILEIPNYLPDTP